MRQEKASMGFERWKLRSQRAHTTLLRIEKQVLVVSCGNRCCRGSIRIVSSGKFQLQPLCRALMMAEFAVLDVKSPSTHCEVCARTTRRNSRQHYFAVVLQSLDQLLTLYPGKRSV